jgi:hypothetical protein
MLHRAGFSGTRRRGVFRPAAQARPANGFEDCPPPKRRHPREKRRHLSRHREEGSRAIGPTWAQVSRRGADREYSEGMTPVRPTNGNSPEIKGSQPGYCWSAGAPRRRGELHWAAQRQVGDADNEAIVPLCRSSGPVITTVSANGVHSLAVSSIHARRGDHQRGRAVGRSANAHVRGPDRPNRQ